MFQKLHIIRILRDIRFWIVLFFLIRLIGIGNPSLEVGHNWRQTTVTMVARNFLEVDNNIFYPRIDMAGEKTGITGMEFPLLNYLIYLTAEVLGYQHWYGRLINLIVSSLGLWFFFKLLRKYFNEETAFYSTIILTVSVWFQFSRKIMPDTFAMSIIIACIYYGTNYLEGTQSKKRYLNLAAYFVLLMLGVLSKLPSAYLLIIFGIFLLNKQITLKRKLIFSVVSLAGLVPGLIWYFYWVPHLVKEYDYWHFFMGKSISQGYQEIRQNPISTTKRFYDTALKFVGFGAFLYGLVISIIKKEWRIPLILILSLAGFSVIMLKGGYTFFHHNYYIIPFVPVMALIAGYGLSKIGNNKFAILLLIVISIEGIANQHHDFRIMESEKALLNLEKDLDKVSSRNELILINSGTYPTPMYFAHRKGWITSNYQIKDKEYIEELSEKGLKYIVIMKKVFGTEITINWAEVLLENEDYCIYRIYPEGE